tara:strand:+ start:2368 stop:2505 length:138 start_codon:yes stop_codon:yes gene_type:complete
MDFSLNRKNKEKLQRIGLLERKKLTPTQPINNTGLGLNRMVCVFL